MKRFYREVDVACGDGGGFVVALDGRPIRTPAKAPLQVRSRALADAVAEEWACQGETVDIHAMRLTRLANSALDRVAPARDAVAATTAAFAEADLLCYRASEPDELVVRQATAWQPLLDWAAERYAARLTVVCGLMPVAQPPTACAALADAVGAHDDFRLTGLAEATAVTGSLVLGLALAEGRIDAEAAWSLSLFDELYQKERWGAEAEAERRREALRADLAAAGRFLDLVR